MVRLVSFLLLACHSASVIAQSPQPMFNGKDLTGWTVVNGAKGTWSVKDGTVITTGKPIGYMRTAKQYENFILEMDWKHINTKEVGNSGLFVWGDALPAVGTGYTRGIEVQVLVNYPDVGWATNHGDIFSIWGAKCKPDRPHPRGIERCLPSENRCKGGGEWNHYKVTGKDGSIKLEVNGKEVSGVSDCSPRKGYLALEAEGAECHFKNVVITELPSSNPKKEWVATPDRGHVMLHDGLTMNGWKSEGKSWSAGDGTFRSNGTGDLTSEKNVRFGELVFDWKLPEKSNGEVTVKVGSDQVYTFANGDKSYNDGKWHRIVVSFGKNSISVTHDGQSKGKSAHVVGEGPITFSGVKELELRNVFWGETK